MDASSTNAPTKPQPAAPSAQDVLHRALMRLNRARLTPTLDATHWLSGITDELELRRMEYDFVERERAEVRQLASQVPRSADAFVVWFERLRLTGEGQGDPLFSWLEHKASLPQMKWFLSQEMAGEAGFDDLVALAQLRMPARVKLELARNYWDELGQGHAGGMHGPMLEALAHELELSIAIDQTVWESLALGNTMTALASNRHYAYQALGALGAVELTAPGRCVQVNAGLKRLGVTGTARRYYALHATLDVKHAAAWQREVLHTLVAHDARTAPLLAEGALLRLAAGARCFMRYRSELMPSTRAKLNRQVA